MRKILFLVLLLLSFKLSAQVVVDSNITFEKALEGTLAPKSVIDSLVLINVEYYSDDNMLHQGQILMNRCLQEDVIEIFEFIKEEKIPIEMVIPIKFDLPDGNTTMANLNNTYGFHYRYAVSSKKLSNHSYGKAIDFNPFDNPYISSTGKIIPVGAKYEPLTNPLSFTSDCKLVKKFKELGWTWGGDWITTKDYMHFEKK
ncbi:MAG: M15 family metallopeptidase [Rikenellaceae bacterium]